MKRRYEAIYGASLGLPQYLIVDNDATPAPVAVVALHTIQGELTAHEIAEALNLAQASETSDGTRN